LILEGDPGVGKSTLWRHGVQLGMEGGYQVLVARPAEPEAQFPLAALADLLDDADPFMDELPDPQRRAIEVALLRRAPQAPLDRRAVATALLGVLRAMAARGPVLVAIDDLQWMDPGSASALEFAVRRLSEDPIRLLLTELGEERGDLPLAAEKLVGPEQVRVVHVGPLNLGDLEAIIHRDLHEEVPRTLLSRVHRASGGNPFFALEIIRSLTARGLSSLTYQTVPIPRNLRALVRDRLAALPEDTRDVLLAVAASVHPSMSLLARLGDPQSTAVALAKASREGVIVVRGDRVQFSHPLLGSVLYSELSADDKRRVHRGLAEIVDDPEQRARHLGQAAAGPDGDVAQVLEDAASLALARDAIEAAAELMDQARRLTPPDQPSLRSRRLSQAAEWYLESGDAPRARRLLEQLLDAMERGPDRARVLRQLAEVRLHSDSWAAAADLLEQALGEADDDDSARATIELDLAAEACFARGDPEDAAHHARSAVELADVIGDRAVAAAARCLGGFVAFVSGRGFDRSWFETGSDARWIEEVPIWFRPGFLMGSILGWLDELEEARTALDLVRRQLLDRGEEISMPLVLTRLAELECMVGDWDASATHAEEAEHLADLRNQESMRPYTRCTVALVRAHRGQMEEAREGAADGLELAKRQGVQPAVRACVSVLAFIDLSLGDGEAVDRLLRPLDQGSDDGFAQEPAMARFVPDHVEALVMMGEVGLAEKILGPFEERSRELGRRSLAAAAGRSRGLALAARGDLEGATRMLEDALRIHRTLPLPMERGRTLLALGQVNRRAKQKRAAREALDEAMGMFEQLGSPLWAAKTRRDLERIGGRAPGPEGLTPTERLVAELVADGKTNPEVAESLFMSRKTVEANLSRIYAKLGVRSRTELAARLVREAAAPG
jgi:ATP/maltotriose-dependent transcriptional regulator MalT